MLTRGGRGASSKPVGPRSLLCPVRTETMVNAPRTSFRNKLMWDGSEGRCRGISSTSMTASGRCTM